jgi:dihydroorotate dehydrogenase electron transfer subunit
MRRPLSIMRADAREGWIDILYKVVGPGLAALARRRPGDRLSVLGPIGIGFTPHPERPRPLLIGGGVGIPPMVFLAETLAAQAAVADGGAAGVAWRPLVLMGSEVPFPFDARPSTILVHGMPDGVIAGMPLLEQQGVPSRLASRSGFPGCFDGFVTELGAEWLAALDPAALSEIEIFACGPTPMLAATARLAARFGLPCQVSLEEFMACAVGGCAGCAVPVRTPAGPAMKRVCVDGPVFDAYAVFDT